MDMSNHPTSAILSHFYTIFGITVIPLILITLIVWIVSNRADESPAPRWHRVLRLSLGGLWILDGFLQIQPSMSTQFIPHVIVPILDGQPAWLTNVIEKGIIIWSQHPLTYDVLSAAVQFLIGVLLILGNNGRLTRWGLGLSVTWSMLVWIFGEGMGSLFAGAPWDTWLIGTPGSSLFYFFASLILLSPTNIWYDGTIVRVGQKGLAALWATMGLIQLWPANGFWTPMGLGTNFLAMANMPQPLFLSSILVGLAHLTTHYALAMNFVLVLTMFTLSALWYRHSSPKTPLIIGTYIWLFITWWLGQDFGVLGGVGTDPNSAFIVALLLTTTIVGPLSERKKPDLLSENMASVERM